MSAWWCSAPSVPARPRPPGNPAPRPPACTSATAACVEANGNDFVMRGVNHAHTWYPSQTSSFADIKALGANTVRVVLGDGHRWTPNSPADVANVIAAVQAEPADLRAGGARHHRIRRGRRGRHPRPGGRLLDQPEGRPGRPGGLRHHQHRQRADRQHQPRRLDRRRRSPPIQKLRSNGFEHLLMVDAPNWGQDWQGVMRDNAQSVLDADTTATPCFSIHMYSVYNTAAEVTDYLNAFVDAELAAGHRRVRRPRRPVGRPGRGHHDGRGRAARPRLPRPGPGAATPTRSSTWRLNFDPAQLTSWGQRIFNGANGIAQTAKEATVFGGGDQDDTQAPTAPGTPAASAVTATSATLTWAGVPDNVATTGYDVVRVSGGAETTAASSTANCVTVTGLPPTRRTSSPSTPATRRATARPGPPR